MKLHQVRSKTYEKSFRKLFKSGVLNLKKLDLIVDKIASREKLPINCKDHRLKGELKDYRECHIHPYAPALAYLGHPRGTSQEFLRLGFLTDRSRKSSRGVSF